ncbi:cell wall-active antibiotics response protein LiaF [Pseudalkalibacillus salsuginis]|uniref:cell wall-active antibiotics response protein LiaF n=1 Tax=Pseudalkalibacillus salsuginis TaxID=2910972 RepID=UPI001F252161|nr:cell wall-active antibiotics response protein LiaF [Pseudalkalibacillus salsuginis]MCF6408917.1 cell wall-active antibiotics response protein LiaF [Pseudalkalibacillus salsuginis]
MKLKSGGQFVVAVIFVLIGVMLLLVNLGIVSMNVNEAFFFLYPFVILLLGLKWLLEAVFTRGRRGSWFMGLFLSVIGGLLVSDRLGFMDFQFEQIINLWPLLLVYIGIRMLWGRRPGATIKKKKKHSKSNFVTDVSMKHDNWHVEDLDEWNGVADFDFDYTRAFIPDKETIIQLSGWVGDIKILIPEDVEFSVTSNTKVGDIKIGNYKKDGLMKEAKYKTEGYDEATRKLTFDFRFQVLDLKINRV